VKVLTTADHLLTSLSKKQPVEKEELQGILTML